MVYSAGEPGTVLIVQDIQGAVVPGFGGDDALLERLQRATAAARRASIPVLFGRVAFRSDYPDVSNSNALFGPLRTMMDFTESNPDLGHHPSVTPEEGDITFMKRRVSSFTGSDLEVILRSQEARRLVLAGVATSGVVLSTLREAADRDYEIVVLSDGCADADPEVHRVLMEKVFPMQATVMTVDDWIGGLKTEA